MVFFEIFKGLKIEKEGKTYTLTGEIYAQEEDSQLSNYLFLIYFIANDKNGKIIPLSLKDMKGMKKFSLPPQKKNGKKSK